jgi:hypothetical protein
VHGSALQRFWALALSPPCRCPRRARHDQQRQQDVPAPPPHASRRRLRGVRLHVQQGLPRQCPARTVLHQRTKSAPQDHPQRRPTDETLTGCDGHQDVCCGGQDTQGLCSAEGVQSSCVPGLMLHRAAPLISRRRRSRPAMHASPQCVSGWTRSHAERLTCSSTAPFEQHNGEDNPFFPPIVVLKTTNSSNMRPEAPPPPESVIRAASSSSSRASNSRSSAKAPVRESDRPSLTAFRSSDSTLVNSTDIQLNANRGSPSESLNSHLSPSYTTSPYGFPDRRGRKELSLTELFTPPISSSSSNTRTRSHREHKERGENAKEKTSKSGKTKASGKEDRVRISGKEDKPEKTKDAGGLGKKRKSHRKAAYSSSSASEGDEKKLDAEKAVAKQSWSKHVRRPRIREGRTHRERAPA